MTVFFDRILIFFFRLHDFLSTFLARHFFTVKKALLLLAHASLLGFFFPEFRREFGATGGNLLILILFLSPLSKIFRLRLLQQLMGLRRELGIMFGYLVTVHGLGYLTDPFIGSMVKEALPFNLFSLEKPFLFGILGYSLTLPLLFTSNNLANRLLGGKNWKRLHRIVYVMALLVVAHRFMMNAMTPVALIEMIILVSVYILAKLVAWRNFLPPLVRFNAWVAEKYRLYWTNLTQAPPGVPPTSPVSPPPLS